MNTTPIGVPQNLAQLTQAGTIYNSVAKSFDMQSLRSTFAANLVYAATDNLNLMLGYDMYKKSGQQPWGTSFAFPNAVEVPLVIDNKTTDVTAAMEWASHQGMMRMGYAYSKFDQGIPSFTFDNPLYATDYNVFSPPLGVLRTTRTATARPRAAPPSAGWPGRRPTRSTRSTGSG